jgi:hypothetical protein
VVDAPGFSHVAGQFPTVTPESIPLKGFPAPVAAYRLGASAVGARPAAGRRYDIGTERSGRAITLGGIIFAVLGAPCAAVGLIGPLALVLGAGSLFGALGTSVLPVLDSAPVRWPLLILSTLAAAANFYTVWHAHRLRQAAAAERRFLPVTRREFRSTALVLVMATVTLLLVAFELYAHEFITHHPWP